MSRQADGCFQTASRLQRRGGDAKPREGLEKRELLKCGIHFSSEKRYHYQPVYNFTYF